MAEYLNVELLFLAKLKEFGWLGINHIRGLLKLWFGSAVAGQSLSKTDMVLSTPPRVLSTSPPNLSTPPQDLSTPPQGLSTPPPDLSTPPPNLSTPPQDLSTPPQDLSTPPQGLSTPPPDLSTPPPELLGKINALKEREHHKDRMEGIILELCALRPMKASEIAGYLNKGEDYIKRKYLRDLIRTKQISYTYPEMINHPDQAYTTKSN